MNKKIKIVIGILLLTISITAKAAEYVSVGAVVGNINHSPTIISIVPNSNPELLETNSLQNFTVTIKDDEQNEIYYTITTGTNGGYTSPISGVINTNEFIGNQAKINFSYLAGKDTGDKKITITLNDGPNIISKDINLYIY